MINDGSGDSPRSKSLKLSVTYSIYKTKEFESLPDSLKVILNDVYGAEMASKFVETPLDLAVMAEVVKTGVEQQSLGEERQNVFLDYLQSLSDDDLIDVH